MKHTVKIVTGVVGLVILQACDMPDRPIGPSASGLDVGSSLAVAASDSGATLLRVVRLSGDINGLIPLFALSIGQPNNGAARGRHEAGRREVNWDGVPAAFNNNDSFPPDFFNVNSPRGLVYLPGNTTGFRVSDNDFSDVNPTYGTDLDPFSAPRLFTGVGSNVVELVFRIPGTNTPAVVASFGAVIVDVDKKELTRVVFYDQNDRVLANIASPVRRPLDAFSLVGVVFSQPVIARVAFVLGDTPIGAGINDVSSGGTKDVVVLDDLMYSEPQPIRQNRP